MSELIKVFSHKGNKVPFWFMRQAGRYLPEYRKERLNQGSFLDLCYNPEKACEVTLQPIRRFNMSAAIIFSDILVIPHALGYDLTFKAGEGPLLEAINSDNDIRDIEVEKFTKFLEPVYNAISLTRERLDKNKSLIGFSGAAWTIACYMLQGRGGKEFAVAREKIYRDDINHDALIKILQESIACHLIEQIKAGADIVQIFDSWAAYVPYTHRMELIYNPTRYVVSRVKSEFPEVPIIGFPKGLGDYLDEYVSYTGVDGVSVDMFSSLSEIDSKLPQHIVIQGNLDPLLLANSKSKTLDMARNILKSMEKRKFIFNLGHGIVPHTPVENVAALSELILNYNNDSEILKDTSAA